VGTQEQYKQRDENSSEELLGSSRNQKHSDRKETSHGLIIVLGMAKKRTGELEGR
jgi:hypothetical protein